MYSRMLYMYKNNTIANTHSFTYLLTLTQQLLSLTAAAATPIHTISLFLICMIMKYHKRPLSHMYDSRV